ncbi:MAG: helix-turn-helix domain-containing protein, partial [Pseudonocardia sp.]
LLEMAATAATLRAAQGVPVDDVLRGWRMGATELWRRQQRIAAEIGIDVGEQLDAARFVLEGVDRALDAAIAGHREGLRRRDGPDAALRARLLRGLLLGTTTAADRDLLASGYRVGPDTPWRAVRARVDSDDEARLAEQALTAAGAALTARVDGEMLAIVPDGATPASPVPAGVGGAAGLAELPRSFAEAAAALATLTTFRRSGAATLDELGVEVAVATRPELGVRLAARYVAPLLATGVAGADVLGTVDTYLRSGLRVHRTAQALYVHPNTVRHRLRRFETQTGARLDDMAEVVGVWWALRHHEAHGDAG